MKRMSSAAQARHEQPRVAPHSIAAAVLLLGCLTACGDSGSGGGAGNAGALGTAGTAAGMAGFTAGAGTNSVGGTTGGTAAFPTGGTNAGATGGTGISGAGGMTSGTGGTMLTGGQPSTGGVGGTVAGTGGVAGTMAGTGGTAAGTGGTAAGAGGTMADAPTPSAGCALASGRPANGLVTTAQGHYMLFPAAYDGTTPMPVMMGFHGCGDVNRSTNANDTEWTRLTNGSGFEDEYVRVVPLSMDTGGCWNYGNDIPRVLALYDDLVTNYCVDTSRVFATGHSSGSQFIVQVLLNSHVSDAQHLGFRAVAPVAASDYGPMTGPIPVMYIQGMMDAERGNGDGHETVAQFRAANNCSDTSMPYTEVDGCQSGATSVNPGCIIYDGCDVTTIWCSHNDPQYNNTMHGVPCFGVTAMYDFFETF